MKRRIDPEAEEAALDWLAETLERGDKESDVVFARQGYRASRCRVLDLVAEAQLRGARLSAAAENLEINPATLQRWKRQRVLELRALDRLLRDVRGGIPR